MFAKLRIHKSGSFASVFGVALVVTFLMAAPMPTVMANSGIEDRGSECASIVFSQDLEDVLLEFGSPMGGRQTHCAEHSIQQIVFTKTSAVVDNPESTSALVLNMRERAENAVVETSGSNTLFLWAALGGLG